MIIDFPEPSLVSKTVLNKVWNKKCWHRQVVVDDSLNTVECKLCGETLNPMWVLDQLCDKEHRYYMRLKELNDTANQVAEKLKCKCLHCGKMTPIYRQR